MRAPRKLRSTRRPRSGWLARDGWRALAACLFLAAVFACAAYLEGWSPLAGRPQSAQQKEAGDSLATGAMLIVPASGNQCRQAVIDNATWRIWDIGTVECNLALSQATDRGPRQMSTARVDVIRDGFTKR